MCRVSYYFLKLKGYPKFSKLSTLVKPKILFAEQKNLGFVNNFPKPTFTPKTNKIYFLRFYGLCDLCWNYPIAKIPINAEKVKCDGPTDGPTDEPTEGPTDGRTDGRTDGPTDRRTDGRTDRARCRVA